MAEVSRNYMQLEIRGPVLAIIFCRLLLLVWPISCSPQVHLSLNQLRLRVFPVLRESRRKTLVSILGYEDLLGSEVYEEVCRLLEMENAHFWKDTVEG